MFDKSLLSIKMKTFVVLSLFSHFYLSLTLPLSQEKVAKDKTLEIDTDAVLKVPINLSTQGKPRNERDLETEIVSVLAQTLETLSRDTDSEDVIARIFTEPLYAEDLSAQNPLLRDSEVVIIQEELTPVDKDVGNTKPNDQEENTDFKARLQERTKKDEFKTVPGVAEEKEEEKFVPKETKAFKHVDDMSIEKPVKEGIERSYKNYDSSKSDQVAVFPSASEGAIPILLNCAPDVLKGHLTAAPSYRTFENDREDKKIKNVESKNNADKFTDVIDLNSPASVINRRRRDLLETGVTHFKVSEDFPERQGNHHLVSADYPVPNMVKITNYQNE